MCLILVWFVCPQLSQVLVLKLRWQIWGWGLEALGFECSRLGWGLRQNYISAIPPTSMWFALVKGSLFQFLALPPRGNFSVYCRAIDSVCTCEKVKFKIFLCHHLEPESCTSPGQMQISTWFRTAWLYRRHLLFKVLTTLKSSPLLFNSFLRLEA